MTYRFLFFLMFEIIYFNLMVVFGGTFEFLSYPSDINEDGGVGYALSITTTDGNQVVSKNLELIGCKDINDISRVFDVPKSDLLTIKNLNSMPQMESLQIPCSLIHEQATVYKDLSSASYLYKTSNSALVLGIPFDCTTLIENFGINSLNPQKITPKMVSSIKSNILSIGCGSDLTQTTGSSEIASKNNFQLYYLNDQVTNKKFYLIIMTFQKGKFFFPILKVAGKNALSLSVDEFKKFKKKCGILEGGEIPEINNLSEKEYEEILGSVFWNIPLDNIDNTKIDANAFTLKDILGEIDDENNREYLEGINYDLDITDHSIYNLSLNDKNGSRVITFGPGTKQIQKILGIEAPKNGKKIANIIANYINNLTNGDVSISKKVLGAINDHVCEKRIQNHGMLNEADFSRNGCKEDDKILRITLDGFATIDEIIDVKSDGFSKIIINGGPNRSIIRAYLWERRFNMWGDRIGIDDVTALTFHDIKNIEVNNIDFICDMDQRLRYNRVNYVRSFNSVVFFDKVVFNNVSPKDGKKYTEIANDIYARDSIIFLMNSHLNAQRKNITSERSLMISRSSSYSALQLASFNLEKSFIDIDGCIVKANTAINLKDESNSYCNECSFDPSNRDEKKETTGVIMQGKSKAQFSDCKIDGYTSCCDFQSSDDCLIGIMLPKNNLIEDNIMLYKGKGTFLINKRKK